MEYLDNEEWNIRYDNEQITFLEEKRSRGGQ